MKKYAVIVAGGSGQRMGSTLPKQFLLLQGKPLLWHTIHSFLAAYTDMQIILVLPASNMEEGKKIVQDFDSLSKITVTEGGKTRFDSVKNGLALVHEEAIIFVHDGVRCLVTPHLIKRCYEQALYRGSAIPVITATDSIRIVEEEGHYVMNRNKVRLVQTPQTFQSNILLKAFEQPYEESFTDEATVVESSGETVLLIEGEYDNMKITRPADLLIAEKIMTERSSLQ